MSWSRNSRLKGFYLSVFSIFIFLQVGGTAKSIEADIELLQRQGDVKRRVDPDPDVEGDEYDELYEHFKFNYWTYVAGDKEALDYRKIYLDGKLKWSRYCHGVWGRSGAWSFTIPLHSDILEEGSVP